jgi:hypothetical protein
MSPLVNPMSLSEASSSLRSSCSANWVVIQRFTKHRTNLNAMRDLTALAAGIRFGPGRKIDADNLDLGGNVGQPFSDDLLRFPDIEPLSACDIAALVTGVR